MTLSSAQDALMKDMIEGASDALRLQIKIMDYEHDHVGTEYIITTKVAEKLVETHGGRVRIEYPTKKIRNVLIRDRQYGKGPGKVPEPKIRSGRIDVVVFNGHQVVVPLSLCEAKINVRSFKSIEKDAVRFANILRLLDAAKTPELFGVCLFPLVESGDDMGKMGAKFSKRIKKIEAQIKTFNSQHPQVEAELTYSKITEIMPSHEFIDENEPNSAYLSAGYLTYLAAVTVVRR